MKRKEQQRIANEFMQLEKIISTSDNPGKVDQAKNRIMLLSSHLSVRDMMEIDELIQSKRSTKD